MRTKFISSFATLISIFLLIFFFSTRLLAQALPLPDHIVVVIEENQPHTWVIGQPSVAPYINSIANDPEGTVFTKMYALEHPSQPNYLDFFAGNNQGILNNDPPANYPFTTPNLARELMYRGYSFKTYSQSLPAVGSDVVSSNGYVRKHNPVTNWVGTGLNQVPDTLNQPFTAFPIHDFSLLPTVSYVVANEDSDMHNGFGNPTISAGDFWLQENLDSYVQWARNHNSLLIYTFDEDNGLYGNNIPTVFFGPMVKGGIVSTTYNLYNILRTIEDIYGSTSHAGNAATSIPILDCWKTQTTGINEVASASTVKVFPNPVSSVIQFEIAKSNTTATEITINDVTGHLIHQGSFEGSSLMQINTAAFSPAMYFYKVVQNNRTVQSGKFIVTR